MDYPYKIYFLSTGRCGTTSFFNFFKEYFPELNITHQTRFSRLMNVVGNIPLVKKQKKKLILNLFKILKGKKFPQSTVDPLLSFPIAYLLQDVQENSNCKIVHLVRDPRTFVPSFMNWKRQSIKRTILHHFIPFWQPSPFFNGVSLMKALKMKKFNKFCWIWNFKNRVFHDLKDNNSYLLIKLEDFQNSNVEVFDSIIEFLELPKLNQKLPEQISYKKLNSSKKNFPAWDELDPKSQSYLLNSCNEMMKELKYI